MSNIYFDSVSRELGSRGGRLSDGSGRIRGLRQQQSGTAPPSSNGSELQFAARLRMGHNCGSRMEGYNLYSYRFFY